MLQFSSFLRQADEGTDGRVKRMLLDFVSQREKQKYFRSLDEEQKGNALNEMIAEAKHIVFLGGVGVSTESGIPDFRSFIRKRAAETYGRFTEARCEATA